LIPGGHRASRGEFAGKEDAMINRHRIARLRREHEELMWLANRIEAALHLGAKHDSAGHRKCRAELRALAPEFSAIVAHCHAENSIRDFTNHRFVSANEHARIDTEHADILRWLAEFREDVRFPVIERKALLLPQGTELIKRLRTHLSFEQELLDRISKTAEDCAIPIAVPNRQQPAIARNAHTHKDRHFIPYTVESHPEL
jgi:hypothetical protein